MVLLSMVDRWIARLEKTIVSACMIIMAGVLLASVICRRLDIVMVGGEEIAQFTVVWLTFWGMALCARKGSHIIMSAVVDMLPREKKKWLITAACLVCGLFCLLLSSYAFDLTWKVFNRGQVTPALRIPIWYMYSSAPAGFFFTGVYYLGGFINNLRSPRLHYGLEPDTAEEMA